MVYIAQLAERWFVEPEAWVRVPLYTQYAPVVELAIHDRLKICCPLRLVGSSPTRSTICTFSSIGRASEYESEGYGFESFKVYKKMIGSVD